MIPAFTTFMSGAIDYAGLFPPAQLEIPPAVAQYARHRAQPQSWMLGRFIAPAEKLEAIARIARIAGTAGTAGIAGISGAEGTAAAGGGPWEFTVLVGERTGGDGALAALPRQGRAVADFAARGGRATVLELPLPAECGGNEECLGRFLRRLTEALPAAGLQGRELFLELPPGAAADAHLAAVGDLRRQWLGHPDLPRIGVKLRCGGVTPEAFPPPAAIAAVIAACVREQVPLKCTAGLHHPVRHLAAEPAVMMHGFLNVLGAACLAHGAGLEGRDLQDCLEETDPRAFVFDDGGFAWRDCRVPVPVLAGVRREFLCGFGSCSFAEPVADLTALGWLRLPLEPRMGDRHDP